MSTSYASISDQQLPDVANCLLAHFPPLTPSDRYEIEEILWCDVGPRIPKRFRREVAAALSIDDLYTAERGFDRLLERLWVMGGESIAEVLLGGSRHSLRAQIERHVFRNQDWSTSELFDRLGAYDCTDHRYARFLEGLASSEVRPDVVDQRRLVETVNVVFARCNAEMRETGEDGGYPVFTLVSRTGASRGRPKNLIFGSPIKPDLRLSDAINNDIEIVSNADEYLDYDRPIGVEGLLLRDLQAWWAERQGIKDERTAKETLYLRLKRSLPDNSPPQRRLFQCFFKAFGPACFSLPALLPEVWLHWDPKTVRERGPRALTRFRMDFLLLLPANVRVVIEVDGETHYSVNKRPSPARYAEMVAADRDLRLAGYEVYRFGGAELQEEESSQTLVSEFFRALFRRHGVAIPEPTPGTEPGR